MFIYSKYLFLKPIYFVYKTSYFKLFVKQLPKIHEHFILKRLNNLFQQQIFLKRFFRFFLKLLIYLNFCLENCSFRIYIYTEFKKKLFRICKAKIKHKQPFNKSSIFVLMLKFFLECCLFKLLNFS